MNSVNKDKATGETETETELVKRLLKTEKDRQAVKEHAKRFTEALIGRIELGERPRLIESEDQLRDQLLAFTKETGIVTGNLPVHYPPTDLTRRALDAIGSGLAMVVAGMVLETDDANHPSYHGLSDICAYMMFLANKDDRATRPPTGRTWMNWEEVRLEMIAKLKVCLAELEAANVYYRKQGTPKLEREATPEELGEIETEAGPVNPVVVDAGQQTV